MAGERGKSHGQAHHPPMGLEISLSNGRDDDRHQLRVPTLVLRAFAVGNASDINVRGTAKTVENVDGRPTAVYLPLDLAPYRRSRSGGTYILRMSSAVFPLEQIAFRAEGVSLDRAQARTLQFKASGDKTRGGDPGYEIYCAMSLADSPAGLYRVTMEAVCGDTKERVSSSLVFRHGQTFMRPAVSGEIR